MTKELKILRIKYDFTQEDVARKLGIDKTTYCKKEKGEIAFSLKDIKKIKALYNLTTEKLAQIFLTES